MARADVKVTTDLDSSKMKAGLTRMQNGIAGMVKGATGKLLALGAVITSLRGLGGLGKLAMEAEEVDSKFKAVFKDSAPEMLRVIEDLKKHIYLTTTEMKNSLATYGAMAQGMGLTEKAGMLFSEAMVKMQGDLASFENLEPEEAFIKLKSAISGEYEPLKQMGFMLNEATVKQEALNMGIYDGTTALTASQKALAVQSLLLMMMGDRVGDAESTADSSMNVYKNLNRELKEMAESIGIFIVPAVNILVKAVTSVTDSFKHMNQASDVNKSKFKEQAEEMLVAEGVLKKFRKGYRLTSKTAEEYGVNVSNNTVRVKLLAEKIKELEEEERKLNNTRNDGKLTEDQKIRLDALREQKELLRLIIKEMGDLFKLQQDELRNSDELVKNKKALLDLEKQREKAMDKADVNRSGVTTRAEIRNERRKQDKIERQRKRVRTAEVSLEGVGGEAEARKKESQSRFGDPSMKDPYTREGRILKEFLEASEKLKAMELGSMAQEKGLLRPTPNRFNNQQNLPPQQQELENQPNALDQSKKGGTADEGEDTKTEKLVEVLEQIKELNETTDENITGIKDLLDKLDSALT